MTAKTAKAIDLSVSLEGGPKSPGPWKKWSKDGAEAVRDYFQKALSELGYEGDFSLVGSQGMKGGRKKVMKLMQVISHKNGIELTAQLASGMSRWRYELIAPRGVDVVDLLAKLETYISETDIEDGPEVTSVEAEVIELNAGNDAGEEEGVDSEPAVTTEEDVDDSTDAASASEFDQASSIYPSLHELSRLSAEHAAASRSAQDNAPEIEKLKREIAEREEMLRMYQEEQTEAEAILASEKHRTAEEKLQKIRAILES